MEKKERTLSIIKPDAVRNKHVGSIVKIFEENGMEIIGMKLLRLKKEEAIYFYKEHKNRKFFSDLVEYMCSGPVVVMCLEGENIIERNRKLMGSTNPIDAEEGTIRRIYGTNIEENAIHGSDGKKTAENEVKFFFKNDGIF
jgi:nucleoside-diphosphate kinase